MSLVKAKAQLDNLDKYLDSEIRLVDEKVHAKKFAEASDKLALMINRAQRDLGIFSAEYHQSPEYPASAVIPSEPDLRAEISVLSKKLYESVEQLKIRKEKYDEQIIEQELESEFRSLNSKLEDRTRRQAEEIQYTRSYKQLSLLKKQSAPLVGVEDELNHLLAEVKRFKKENNIPVKDLTRALNAAYDHLTGGSKEKFDQVVHEINSKDSAAWKILGGALIALSIALAASLIFFAPAVLTAATVGLATGYAFTLFGAAASTGLAVAGTACINHNTSKMELAQTMEPLANERLEADHYEPVGLQMN